MEERLERCRKKADDLRATIEMLWNRLDIESEIREIFSMENGGFQPSTIRSVSLVNGANVN